MLVEKNLIGYSWFKKYRDEGCLKASTNLSLRIRAPYNSSARNESDALKDLFVVERFLLFQTILNPEIFSKSQLKQENCCKRKLPLI